MIPQVIFDFLHHFNGYDGNLFKMNWVNSVNSIQNVFKKRECAKDFTTEYADEVKPFLMLLKKFPARFSGRKSAHRLAFDDAVEKFIIFQKVKQSVFILFDETNFIFTFQDWHTNHARNEVRKYTTIYCCNWIRSKAHSTIFRNN